MWRHLAALAGDSREASAVLCVSSGEGPTDASGPERTRVAACRVGVGAGQLHHPRAVERTVLFSLYCYAITVVRYTLHGHHPRDAAERRERAPWCSTKADPSVADMAAKLRRVIIAARFSPICPGRPTDQEIRAVQQTWAAAGLDTTV
ncbi:hypothetical protein [Streptomyces sp. JNUCC 63]